MPLLRSSLAALYPLLAALCLSAAAVSLTGCMLSPTASPTVEPAVITGTVHGGQSPVTGARIFVFEAAATGYGKPAVSDILPASGTLDTTYNAYYVTTDNNGSFGLTGTYTCTPGAMVYLLATQGNPGLAAGKTNPALAEMATLGACPAGGALSPALNITISEATTVASVYALAGYMTAPNAVSRPATTLAQTGLNNAFATVGNLVTANGYALLSTPGSNSAAAPFKVTAVPPYAKINLLANVMAACVNSDGTAMACSTLFNNATSDGTAFGTVPADTLTAMLNIAHNPGVNIGTLFPLASASGPFQPTTTTQPNDFTLPVAYTFYSGTALIYPVQNQVPSLDASGNVVLLVTNSAGARTYTLSNLGAGVAASANAVAPGSGATAANQYAIDQSGYAWRAAGNLSTSVGSLTRYSVLTGTETAFNATLTFPIDVAIDSSAKIYVADPGGRKINIYNNDGSSNSTVESGSTWTHLQVDASGNILSLAALNSNLYVNGTAFNGGGVYQPGNLAIDSAGAVWTANDNGSLSKFTLATSGGTTTATAVSGASGYTGGGIESNSTYSAYAPVVMDGGSTAWFPNYDSGTISRLSNTGAVLSPAPGYLLADKPTGLAIDGSGNVWTIVYNNSGTTPTLYETIGAAVPLAKPILPGQFGARP